MKLLAVILLMVCAVVAEPPAPYAPSGWRPSGPAFELPRPGQSQQQPSQYLPPLDPRNPVTVNIPNVDYGVPEEDVSVQGLPPQREEVAFFQRSPINGQQNVGANFNADIRNLDQNLQQIQYQQQQQNYREFQRQRELEEQFNAKRLPRPEPPASFVPRSSSTTESSNTPEVTTVASTTEISLNKGETLEPRNEKVSVEISAQKIQEYPGELFLSSLAQLQLQPQFVPLQFGQLKAPLYLQPVQSQKQVAYDAQTHFAALPSVLAQQKQQVFQNPAILASEQPKNIAQLQPVNAYQPQLQSEEVAVEPQILYRQANGELVAQNQLQQVQPQFQLQPFPQFAVQPALDPKVILPPAQLQPQSVQFPPQPTQFQPQPNNQDAENIDPNSYQLQSQRAYLIPQPQSGFFQAQIISPQDFPQQQNQFQEQNQPGPDALQSGLNVNQQGNDIDDSQDQDEENQDDNTTATAVAAAFGTRTQPRVYSQYGSPFPVPKVQVAPLTTTEAPMEEVTDDGPVVAHAVAIADGSRKKNAKLRRSRIRPIFTLDKSGHLVLAQQ